MVFPGVMTEASGVQVSEQPSSTGVSLRRTNTSKVPSGQIFSEQDRFSSLQAALATKCYLKITITKEEVINNPLKEHLLLNFI